MAGKILIKGAEAVGEAAIRAGCRAFFGYPITPQSQLLEYMARRMPEVQGGVFLQTESELAAIYMVYGAALGGVRAMTSSSGPGISLMQEAISYLCATELPCVIANFSRGGPGLGGIHAAGSDYHQATRGGGHSDYHTIVLAPSTVQEMVDQTGLAFELADRYRNPVIILADGLLAQMMESVELGDGASPGELPPKNWALTGARGRPRRVIHSIAFDPEELERFNLKLEGKYQEIRERERRFELKGDEGELLIIAFGTAARMAGTAQERAREEGLEVSLFRPITLWPFPYEELAREARGYRRCLVLEMSLGQMYEDVLIALPERQGLEFYGRTGGVIPSVSEILGKVRAMLKGAEALR